MTGVAALRRPRAASTRPTPIHTIGRAAPRAVSTRSPTASRSTGTSPSGVASRVPAQKHSAVTSAPALLSVAACTVPATPSDSGNDASSSP